jgi:uncharacterized protein with HEPN domain
MQLHPKNDLVYFLTVLESTGKIIIYTENFNDAQTFYEANEQLNFNASLLLIATIGDQIAKISPVMKKRYPHIPWVQIKGMRNRIVHDYSGVDFDLTFYIVKTEITQLKSNFEELVKIELSSGVLSMEELEVARNSSWYQHVNFNSLI